MKILKVVMGIVLVLFMFLQVKAEDFSSKIDHNQKLARSQVPLPPQISYNAAYNHGCSTARGNRIKNTHAYKYFSEYRRGWNAGYKKCQRAGGGQDDINPRNSYDIGYNHGCSTARGNRIKNRNAYRKFSDYRRGWSVGYKMCKRGIRNKGRNKALNSYKTGYDHGCNTAHGNRIKNANAYKRFSKYKRGWNAGKRDCRRPVINNALNSYNIGYKHGCSSAQGTWIKRSTAFRDFGNYRKGWNAGNKDCRIPATTVMEQPIIEEIKNIKNVQDEIQEAAKNFIQAKYIQDSLPKSIKLQIRTIQMNEKYGVLEFAVIYEDGSPPAKQDILDREYMLCMEKTDDGWEVIYDLTRSDVPSNEEIITIKEALPEDFPLDSFLKSWMDLLNRSQQATADSNITNRNGDKYQVYDDQKQVLIESNTTKP